MLIAGDVVKVLYEFMQACFGGRREFLSGKVPSARLVVKVKNNLKISERLAVEEVLAMPLGEQQALHEIISQHLILAQFCENEPTPHDFLDGCEPGRLGVHIVRLLSDCDIPFPGRLPK